jgi:L,D-peptidoglycan transpeptidase YkuD (ErfK/YbiS/YcfS/YnhG family)
VSAARPGDLVVGRWGARFLGRRFACAIGRGGIRRDKREGDGATPAAPMRLVAGAWRADRLARPVSALPLRPIGPGDIWSDDPADPDYNHGLRAPGHSFGHERMRRGDGLYDLVLMTDWNWPRAQPGAGSAIFVHVWRKPRHPTAGCVAFALADLIWIAARIAPEARLLPAA